MIAGSYIATDLSKTTSSLEIDWTIGHSRGDLLSCANNQEGSMGRIMTHLPPADVATIDITLQNPW